VSSQALPDRAVLYKKLWLIPPGTRCGIQAVSNHGIAGRGVLLDYYGWKCDKGESYDSLTSHAIHLDELLAVAKHQNVSFEAGDILLIRSGYTDAYYKYEKDDPSRLDEAGSLHPCLAGVAQTEEMKTWLHDKYEILPTDSRSERINTWIVTLVLLLETHRHLSAGHPRNGLW
jgi:hypothetical protein